MSSRTIKIDYLARVEGEGALYVRARNGKVREVRLDIFEPPRLFEAFLRGRAYTDAPDITSRICGICPVAYQTSASNAMEAALGIQVDERVRALRRLIYCGEWIESHVLHVFMLHAPDFLGYQDAVAMAQDHPAIVERGLRMKKAGNTLIEVIGGRAVHPVNMRVGGFHKAPRPQDLTALRDELAWARDAASETVRWTASLPFPEYERGYTFMALRDDQRYAIEDGRIATSAGHEFPAAEFERHVVEKHVEHSSALHAEIAGRGPYLTGPLARFALNRSQLTGIADEAAREAGLGEVCRNPFQSIVVRSVEVLYAFDEAIRLIDAYEPPEPAAFKPDDGPLAAGGTGHGVSEAPRGTLYHRYDLVPGGDIQEARIVPPTSQNQRSVELDLAGFVEPRLALPKEQLTWECEQLVRSYDPCISCATHFLNVDVEHEA